MKSRISVSIAILSSFIIIFLVMPPAVVADISGGSLSFRYLSSLMNEQIEPEHMSVPEETQIPVTTPAPTPVQIPTPTPEPTPAAPTPTPTAPQETLTSPTPVPEITITISAAGDTIPGGCPKASSYSTFMAIAGEIEDMSYFLQNVRHIFEEDDLTILNLEGVFTNETRHMGKRFNHRADPRYVDMLSSSSVEAVSLANNHTEDYFEKGYNDTIEILEDAGVAYFGNEFNTILEIKGVKVGLFGYLMWAWMEDESKILASIEELKENGAELIIAYFHWGEEYVHTPNQSQRRIGRFTIDNGADLVLGAHPHIVQGIEVYNGKNIVYSLGNFAYGGHANPPDKDTFIFQQTFTFVDGILQDTNDTNIIPAFISSNRHRNNYQPMIAEGDEAVRILERLERLSNQLVN